jgi:hypothetical protein
MSDHVSAHMSDSCAQSYSESGATSDSSSEVVSDGDWLRRTAPAARLGISERMLDRQLAAGRWSNRLTPEGHVEVQLPRPPAEGQREAERALVLIKRFQQQLEAQTAPLVARTEAPARENGALQNQVQTLQAQLAAVPTTGPTRSWWAALLWWRR